jgi:hypothetical protein
MSSVPPEDRGAASGMRSTFQNSGMALSIGVFFSLLIAGMSARLPHAVTAGLQAHGVTARAAQEAASVPPVTTVFSAFLGIDPMRALLARSGGPQALPTHDAEVVGGHRFFPQLISVPFHDGLVVVFTTALAMSLLAALASLLRGAPVLAAEGKRESNRS